MNERLKDLSYKAVLLANEVFDYEGKEYSEIVQEKFAELIIRECMEVASPNYMSTPEDAAYYVEEAIDRIADHFGVEE